MLPTRSLNHSTPFGRHNGPSRNLNGPSTFSTFAPAGTMASSAGSSRTTELAGGGVCAAVGAASGALEHPTANIERAANPLASIVRIVICLLNYGGAAIKRAAGLSAEGNDLN